MNEQIEKALHDFKEYIYKTGYKDGYEAGFEAGRNDESANKTDDIIRVGDEIECAGTRTRKIVVNVTSDSDTKYYLAWGATGASTENSNYPPTKTGRHVELSDIFKEIL